MIAIEHKEQQSLHEFFVDLISKKAKVNKEDVTYDWIISKRKTDIYPNADLKISSSLGGYHSKGLLTLTQREINTLVCSANRKLKEILASK